MKAAQYRGARGMATPLRINLRQAAQPARSAAPCPRSPSCHSRESGNLPPPAHQRAAPARGRAPQPSEVITLWPRPVQHPFVTQRHRSARPWGGRALPGGTACLDSGLGLRSQCHAINIDFENPWILNRSPSLITLRRRSFSAMKGYLSSKSRNLSLDKTTAPCSSANRSIHSSASEPPGTIDTTPSEIPSISAKSALPRWFFPPDINIPMLASK